MLHRRFKVDDRHICILRKRIQDGIGALLFPILQSSKSSDADADTVSSKHANELRHVLCLIRIHHSAFTMLERPTRPARLKHYSVPAKLEDADLHRGARPQRGIEEDERDRATLQRLHSILTALEPQGRLNQLFKLFARPICCCQKISQHYQLPLALASRSSLLINFWL